MRSVLDETNSVAGSRGREQEQKQEHEYCFLLVLFSFGPLFICSWKYKIAGDRMRHARPASRYAQTNQGAQPRCLIQHLEYAQLYFLLCCCC